MHSLFFQHCCWICLLTLGLGTTSCFAQDREPLDGCPDEVEQNRDRIERFLTDEKWTDERDELGLSEGTGQIQLLTDQSNPDVCQRLGEGSYVSDWLDRTFYSVGPYYVKVSSYKPQEERPSDELVPVDASMMFLTLGEDKYELHGIYGASLVLDDAPE